MVSLRMTLPAFPTPRRVWCDDHFSTVVSVRVVHVELQGLRFVCLNEAEQVFGLHTVKRKNLKVL